MTARYDLPPGTSLRVVASSANVTVIAEDRPDVEAPDGARVETRGRDKARDGEGGKRHRRPKKALRILHKLAREFVHGPQQRDPTLEIRAPRGSSRDLEVRCPTGTPVSVGTISGDVRLRGDFGPATVTTTSGDIFVDHAAALDVRSVSGDLEVDCCSGLTRLNTKSGHIEAGDTGPTQATSVSGRVRLRNTAGGVTVRTISGNVEMGTDGTEAVNARTVSGRITVRVPKERLPAARLHSLSGKINCDCPLGSDFPLEVTSVSGRIEVEPA
jgi:DUF4097 and DUF4098 domain-containing protein YvlB